MNGDMDITEFENEITDLESKNLETQISLNLANARIAELEEEQQRVKNVIRDAIYALEQEI